MEFFARVRTAAPASFLQRHVTVANLAKLCASIECVVEVEGERGEIACPWGRFRVHREVLRGGVRFSLPGCASALQWCVTTARQDPGSVTVHLTINSPDPAPEFTHMLSRFVDDWRHGLEHQLAQLRAEAAPKPGPPAMPWYG